MAMKKNILLVDDEKSIREVVKDILEHENFNVILGENSEEAIRKASKMNVCKVNIDTDLRLAMTSTIRKEFDAKPENFDPRKYLGPARAAIKEVVKHKLQILGCAGKA